MGLSSRTKPPAGPAMATRLLGSRGTFAALIGAAALAPYPAAGQEPAPAPPLVTTAFGDQARKALTDTPPGVAQRLSLPRLRVTSSGRLHLRRCSRILSNSASMSAIPVAVANSFTALRTSATSTSVCVSSNPRISSRSFGRRATAFMMSKSSTLGSRTSMPPTTCAVPLSMADCSNGNPPKTMSRSIAERVCRRSNTRLWRANPNASGMRGTIPYRAAPSTADDHASSGSMANASMSRVSLGRPRIEEATPPMMTAGMRVSSSHFTRSASAAWSDAWRRSTTQGLPPTRPSLTDFANLTFAVRLWTEGIHRSHERCKLRELRLDGRALKLRHLGVSDVLPPGHVGQRLLASDLVHGSLYAPDSPSQSARVRLRSDHAPCGAVATAETPASCPCKAASETARPRDT